MFMLIRADKGWQGTMVTGWDKTVRPSHCYNIASTHISSQGPVLHYVDSDGQRLKNDLFSVGSGSTHAYGVLDGEYKYDMTEAEALELGRRAIYHATYRDAYSGGSVRSKSSDLNNSFSASHTDK